MFGKIAAFEFRYQLRQPVFWVLFGLFFLFFFGTVTVDQMQIGSGGNVHKNAAFAIAQKTLIGVIFFMFVSTAFVANIVVRDDETGFGPIVRSTRVSKASYLFGRFLGAYGAVCVTFLAIPLAILIGSWMPWVDRETLNPFRPLDYVYAYTVLGLPGLLLTSAIFFALATVTRSMMGTYLGVVGFLVAYIVLNALMSKPDLKHVAALVEPFGVAAYGLAGEYWTATERNFNLAPLRDGLLFNRLIWLGVSLAFLALAYVLYSFGSRGAKPGKAQKLLQMAPADALPLAPLSALPKPHFGAASAWAQFVARTRLDMGQVFKSPAFLVLLVLGIANSGPQVWFAGELYGTHVYPVTRVAIQTLSGAFTIFPIIIALYYAGELVWRERDRRTHEIVDSTAVPDWTFVIPKIAAIALVLLSTLLVSVLTAMVVQTLKGFTHFELAKYFDWYVWPMAVDFALTAVLAVFLQVISPNKFVGWGLMVIYLVADLVLGKLGLEHNLYHYGSGPSVPLSDMNGMGQFWRGAWWFRLYWSAFALILTVLAYALWRRGTETRLLPRLRRLPARLKGLPGVLVALGLVVFVASGAFIFVNTNVWNPYRTNLAQERYQADYEKTLLRYENVPQPSVDKVVMRVDIQPHAPDLKASGAYELVNKQKAPLDAIHVRFDRDVDVKSLEVDGAHVSKSFPKYNYRILSFDQPMQPGETRMLRFSTEIRQHGFKNSGGMTKVVDNGTFVNNFDFAPMIGMGRESLLKDRSKRRKYHLPEDLRPPKLGDPTARNRNYIDNAPWTQADITVSTVADQTPIAPGYKVSDVTAGGRRTARFVTDAPILLFFSVQSGRYAEKIVPYKGVNLAVYYDPQHPYNVDRMIAALKLGLDYDQANFSKFQFRQARIIEFPAYADFAQSFANTIPWSENLGFIADVRPSDKIDYVTYVAAHELGHQWWAHQIVGADEQGATVLSETLAQYSALMAMEKLYGPAQIRRFLKYELNSYLRSRGGEVVEELPLARVEDQGYIHYRKGSLVMYLLRDRLGEETVNRALRDLLSQYAFKDAPYPTSLDLIADLRKEAGPDPEKQALITDLFERITLYDVKATKAEVHKRPDGRFDVTLNVTAKKLYANGAGVETEAPLHETFDIGLFTAQPGDKGFTQKNVLLFTQRPLHTGTQTFTFITDTAPKFAGADPYNKRIDRNSDDNVVKVG